jgi:hypothetical protein
MHNRRANGSRLKWIACTYNWAVVAIANPITPINYACARGTEATKL